MSELVTEEILIILQNKTTDSSVRGIACDWIEKIIQNKSPHWKGFTIVQSILTKMINENNLTTMETQRVEALNKKVANMLNGKYSSPKLMSK